MDHLNVCVSAPARIRVKECLIEKGFECYGWAITDPYLRINQANFSFHSFREVKGQKFVYFRREDIAPLRLVPKEATNQFIMSVAK